MYNKYIFLLFFLEHTFFVLSQIWTILMRKNQQSPIFLYLYTHSTVHMSWCTACMTVCSFWVQFGETPSPPPPMILNQVEILEELILALSSRWNLSECYIFPLTPFHPPQFSKCLVSFSFYFLSEPPLSSQLERT